MGVASAPWAQEMFVYFSTALACLTVLDSNPYCLSNRHCWFRFGIWSMDRLDAGPTAGFEQISLRKQVHVIVTSFMYMPELTSKKHTVATMIRRLILVFMFNAHATLHRFLKAL